MSRSDRRCWVVKVGSALLTDLESGLNRNLIAQLVGELAELRREGVDVVVVSSGSIVEGMQRLGWQSRPHERCCVAGAGFGLHLKADAGHPVGARLAAA